MALLCDMRSWLLCIFQCSKYALSTDNFLIVHLKKAFITWSHAFSSINVVFRLLAYFLVLHSYFPESLLHFVKALFPVFILFYFHRSYLFWFGVCTHNPRQHGLSGGCGISHSVVAQNPTGQAAGAEAVGQEMVGTASGRQVCQVAGEALQSSACK